MLTIDGTKVYSNQAALDELGALAAKVAKTKAIVEVGVFRGGSARVLAENARGHVYGIDTWGLEGAYASGSESPRKYGIANMREAERHCAGLDNLSLIRAFSTDAARDYDGPKVGLWYLDAEHTYAAVLADFAAWEPHFGKGCVVAFDDYRARTQGVVDAVDELVAGGRIGPVRVVGDRLAVSKALG